MRAVVISDCGGPEVVKVVADHPAPKREAGKVLIKAVSVGVNPVDLLIRDGIYRPDVFPKILGGDVAGYVEEADEGSKFKKGDKVMALTLGYMKAPDGCYAELVVADEDSVASVPENLPLEQAAGVPLVALTAWQALQQGKPQAGQRVLITAAAGGVGHVAVQLAKALGLFVVGVAGPKNVEWVKSLGADEVVDYSSQDLVSLYGGDDSKKFDLALDLMGTRSDLTRQLLTVTKPSGHLSHIFNAGTDHKLLDEARAAHEAGKGPSVGTTLVQPNGADLQQISDLIGEGKVKLEVALSVPLEEVHKAHEQIATGHTRGKVVLTL